MNKPQEDTTILTNKVMIKPDCVADFANWQAKINAEIAAHPGFVSLEILSPVRPEQPEWLLVQRFHAPKDVVAWHQSEPRKKLMEELNQFLLTTNKENVSEVFSSPDSSQGKVTEVFVTQVDPENEKAYRAWMAKIHEVEAKFPGFRGVYMQSPSQTGGRHWITLLQFDTPENLDRWLNSSERQKVLSEAETLIANLESHRMISPYAGWFASVTRGGELPSVWKQTMLVLLVLFPIVMFELKYLAPLTATLNSSLAMFIANAISVTLISWPMMPIALLFLSWWLAPKQEKRLQYTIIGTVIILVLYLIEILILWNFL